MSGQRGFVAVAAALLALTGCGGAADHGPHRLAGTFAVHGAYGEAGQQVGPGIQCRAAAVGYPTVHPGTPVTIRDGRGAVIGRATLGPGRLSPSFQTYRQDCVYPFSLSVPDAESYDIAVGGTGSTRFSRQEMLRSHWRPSLFIGNYAPGI